MTQDVSIAIIKNRSECLLVLSKYNETYCFPLYGETPIEPFLGGYLSEKNTQILSRSLLELINSKPAEGGDLEFLGDTDARLEKASKDLLYHKKQWDDAQKEAELWERCSGENKA